MRTVALKKYLLMKLTELKKNILDAKKASTCLLILTKTQRRNVLLRLAELLTKNTQKIITANRKDILMAERYGKTASFIERLSIDDKKITAMVKTIRTIAHKKDILFKTLEQHRRPNGLLIKKVRFPLGLVGIIYESRPNVTIDTFTLAFKSGNALLLKGGKEIRCTNVALITLIRKALASEHVNQNIVKDIRGLDKKLSIELMRNTLIDCLIPRGGKNLITFVKNYARVPVIITGASVVHTYVDASGEIESAVRIIINSKTRRVSICNALVKIYL